VRIQVHLGTRDRIPLLRRQAGYVGLRLIEAVHRNERRKSLLVEFLGSSLPCSGTPITGISRLTASIPRRAPGVPLGRHRTITCHHQEGESQGQQRPPSDGPTMTDTEHANPLET
jgi:hypothetical protein